jgi:16S rRNA (cytidine1402-2'-O)-methyltransferase
LWRAADSSRTLAPRLYGADNELRLVLNPGLELVAFLRNAGAVMTDATLPPLRPGTLYLVATPIGNLEDITLRALRVLRECDVVAAEDTRHSGRLLQHFGISKPMLSYFQFNECKRSEEILERLGRGEKIALVTDAGSPGISDPGARVVAAARAAGLRVEAVPGPCALVAALTASGLPTDEFHFVGFLPHKSGQRRRQLEALRTVPGTIILYESPYRIVKLLEELAELYPNRKLVLARELTKKFEEFKSGPPRQLLEEIRSKAQKGEFVALLAPEPGL